MSNKRKINDGIMTGVTYGSSFISITVLLAIIVFVFVNGFKLLNWDLVTHNFEAVSYIADLNDDTGPGLFEATKTFEEGIYYSEKWGVLLENYQF